VSSPAAALAPAATSPAAELIRIDRHIAAWVLVGALGRFM
jgi:hypothetical protein